MMPSGNSLDCGRRARRRTALICVTSVAFGVMMCYSISLNPLSRSLIPSWPALNHWISLLLGASVAAWLLGGRVRNVVLGQRCNGTWFAIAASGALGIYFLSKAMHTFAVGWHAGAPPGLMFSAEVVFFAPLVEELTFRGVMWTACVRLMRPLSAILFTAIVFALYHGPSRVQSLPSLFVAGVFLAWLRFRSKSVEPCVLAHTVVNACDLCRV